MRLEGELLAQHPARTTVEIRSPSGQSLGRYEAIRLWDVVLPHVAGVPDSLYREFAVLVAGRDGRRVVLAAEEVVPQAGLPPLLLLRRVDGRIGDTVRVPVRGAGRVGHVEREEVERALAPAVRLRYRLRTELRRMPPLQFPALIVGTDVKPWRWISGAAVLEVVRVAAQVQP